jgi:hypothetical protein
MYGVAATSSSNAWATGWYFNGTANQTLIEHWNGTAWKKVASPNPGGSSRLNGLAGVAATSKSNAWAVGDYGNGTAIQTMILHWNGSAWKKVPSPSVTSFNALYGVVATSSSNAWAVGDYHNGTGSQTLILHWNGTKWKRQTSPNPGGSSNLNDLFGVAATSKSNAWAVGDYTSGTGEKTLILHWNGTAWKKVPSPNVSSATANLLYGVGVTSSSNAWAVGAYDNGTADQTLVLHWNGTAWNRQKSPNPGGSTRANNLNGVAATSSTNVWVAGNYDDGSEVATLVLRRC